MRLDQYQRAVCYFEHVTGLPAHDQDTFVGRLPTESLRGDLDRWDWWLATNRSRVAQKELNVPAQCLGEKSGYRSLK